MHSTHTLQWKQFLESDAGKAGLEEMRNRMPRVFDRETPLTNEARALKGTERQAWEDCIDEVKKLGELKKQKPTSAGYADMTDSDDPKKGK